MVDAGTSTLGMMSGGRRRRMMMMMKRIAMHRPENRSKDNLELLCTASTCQCTIHSMCLAVRTYVPGKKLKGLQKFCKLLTGRLQPACTNYLRNGYARRGYTSVARSDPWTCWRRNPSLRPSIKYRSTPLLVRRSPLAEKREKKKNLKKKILPLPYSQTW